MHRVVLPLRGCLVLLFGILVVFQTLSLPGQFAYLARQSPELAYLRWPLTAVSVFWVPGLPLLLLMMSVGVAVAGLLMAVMRALLRQATTLRTDMEAVI
jgi:hypothetical protein